MRRCIEPDAMRRPPILAHRKVMRWSSGRSPGSRAECTGCALLQDHLPMPFVTQWFGTGSRGLAFDSLTVAGAASELRSEGSKHSPDFPIIPRTKNPPEAPDTFQSLTREPAAGQSVCFCRSMRGAAVAANNFSHKLQSGAYNS